MIKNILKTTAALATLFAGSQTWGSTISISSIASDGSLGATHSVHGAIAVGTMPAIAVQDKAVLALGATAVAATSGGILALGKELYLDIGVTGWTILDLVATENLDVFLRPSTAATATAFTFTNVVLVGGASTVKFWGAPGISVANPTSIMKEAKKDRNVDTISTVDLPAAIPTKKIGGRTYTLLNHYSSN